MGQEHLAKTNKSYKCDLDRLPIDLAFARPLYAIFKMHQCHQIRAYEAGFILGDAALASCF